MFSCRSRALQLFTRTLGKQFADIVNVPVPWGCLPCFRLQEDRSNPVVSEADANDVDQEIEELCQEVAQVR